MTIPMPEPVAYCRSDEPAAELAFSWSGRGKKPWHNLALITTAQAEAYKDACVREALEADFDKSFALLSAWMRSTQSVGDVGQIATLTALVEFALTNQGKTSDQLESEYRLPAPPTE